LDENDRAVPFFSAPQKDTYIGRELIMKMKKYLILAIVSFSILIVLWPAQQITGETDLYAKEKKTDSNLTALQKLALFTKRVPTDGKEILQGLEGVEVLVESIEPEVEKYGLRRQALQTDTELQLRQYGIKVLTREESLSTPGGPVLYINVAVIIQEKEPVAAAVITVQLRETVLLLREPTRICSAARTWQTGGMWTDWSHRIENIREVVKDYVSEFINDYLAANPTKKPTVSSLATKPPQKGLIRGIVYSGDNPSALIGDRTVHKGDTIGSVTIVRIYTDRVVFEKQGTESTIIWTQKIGEAPEANWE